MPPALLLIHGACAGDQAYQYPCRCGDSYVLLHSQLAAIQSAITVPCSTCSNHILVSVPQPPNEVATK
jgi:predicted SprT family Zn-dependent metalloprotease